MPRSNPKAPTTPTMAAVAPASAGRTGRARARLPRSKASPAPITAGGGPTRRSAPTTEKSRTAERSRLTDVARTAQNAAPTMTASATTGAPGPRTSQSRWVPEAGSSRPANPTGNHRDRAMAVPNAIAAPAAAVMARGRTSPVISPLRVKPMARRAEAGSASP